MVLKENHNKRGGKMGIIFGTDGIRGIANMEPMTGETVLQVGRAVAYLFKRGGGRRRILIGKDTRISGYMIECALASGICSMGVDVVLIGPLPTSGIAYLTSSMRADAGIVISASHNPYPYNGIKIFGRDGYKLPDDMEATIEGLILSKKIDSIRPTGSDIGKAYRLVDAVGRYVVFLKNAFPQEFDMQGLKIVVDCANGATYRVAPAVFDELGAKVIPMDVSPNGVNINNGCGSVFPESMAKRVIEEGADIGVAFDGDGDRVIIADEKGNILDGDDIMGICGIELLNTGKLKKNTVVATIMTNKGLEIFFKERGCTMIRTRVGDRYVVEELVKGDYNFGGEQSGHIIFKDYHTTGDGIITSLNVIAIMLKKNKPLSELSKGIFKLPQVLLNVEIENKNQILESPVVKNAIKNMEEKLGERGRVVVRPSGTEPVIRIMVEGENIREISSMAEELSGIIKKISYV